MEKSPKTTALIIPALNEAPVIGGLLDRIPRHIFGTVIVADNGSADDTAATASQRGAIVVRQPERGYGAACLKALEHLPAEIDTIVFIQADLSEDPLESGRLLAPIQSGRADLVIGSRTLGNAEPGALLPHQRFGNRLATSMVRLLYGFRYSDICGFRAIRRDALERLGMKDRNYGWTIEMQVRALEEGLRVVEVPISYRRRAAGENKVSGNVRASIAAGWIILTTILKLWLRSPRSGRSRSGVFHTGS